MEYAEFLNRLNLRGVFRIRPGLDRVRTVLNALANPQDRVRCVHIAGTNGKGSVAAGLESILRAAGYRTGLYTSPHLWDIRERIQIDRRPISVSRFWQAARQVLQAEQKVRVRLTYFEFLTAMGYAIFADSNIDIAIIETGLGGRWDATNVVVRPELCVITSIGLDHTRWLGKTPVRIAREKAGIIKPNVPLVCGASGTAAKVIARIARAQNAPLLQWGKDFKASAQVVAWSAGRQQIAYQSSAFRRLVSLNLLGPHQVDNAGLVIAAADLLTQRGWKISESALTKGLGSAEWAGRLQAWPNTRNARVLFDGAHNPPALRRLVDSLQQSPWAAVPKTVIFGVYADKDFKSMLRIVAPKADHVILCTLPGSRSLSAARASRAFRHPHKRVIHDPLVALQEALASTPPNHLIVVTGSLTLVGMLLNYVTQAPELPALERRSSSPTRTPVALAHV